MTKIAYDKDLFLGLTWAGLIENANEAITYATEWRPCGVSPR